MSRRTGEKILAYPVPVPKIGMDKDDDVRQELDNLESEH
jgi:hypothetical protein